MIVEPVHDGKTGSADQPHDKVFQTQWSGERIKNIIYRDPLLFQKQKAVITLKVVLRIQTINGDGIIVLSHFPHDRRNMIDVIELSDKK